MTPEYQSGAFALSTSDSGSCVASGSACDTSEMCSTFVKPKFCGARRVFDPNIVPASATRPTLPSAVRPAVAMSQVRRDKRLNTFLVGAVLSCGIR